MKKFRVVIESDFIHLAGDARLYGYFTALEVTGIDAKHAFQDVIPQLIRCINSKNIDIRATGIFQTRYLFDKGWEVDEVNDEAPDFVGGGFVIFPIRPVKALTFVARYWLIRVFRPHLVFHCDP